MRLPDSATVATFFALLRSGLYGRPIPEAELPESIDWGAINRFALKHAVLGIIIDAAQFLPPHLRPTGSIAARMSKFALGLIQANVALEKTAARIVEFFRQYGIEGVLLKGQGVGRSYYRQPQMRHSGDIDFYVGKKRYKEAFEACLQGKLIEGGNHVHETDQHFVFDYCGAPIEIHCIASKIFTPSRNRRFQKWTVEELEQSPGRRAMTVGDTDIILPSCNFDAVYIFYHAWRHYIMGGIGLRQLCDWAMIFHSRGNDIDLPRLEADIRRFGLTKGWKIFACIAVDHLGLAPEKMPLYDPAYRKKSEKAFDEIITGGNFGYYSEAIERTPIQGHGLWHALGKVRNITNYYFDLLPLMPAEATFLYLHRLRTGFIARTKRSGNKQ